MARREARRLTEQQKLWAKNYVANGYNATKAAISAGYAEKYASSRGYECSHNALVLQYVAELVAKIDEKLDIDATYVRDALHSIDNMRWSDVYDEDGVLLPMHQWPDAWQKYSRKGEMPDKLKNLELLGKHVDVKAWDKDANDSKGPAEPLHITFEVAEAKADVRVTNAKP